MVRLNNHELYTMLIGQRGRSCTFWDFFAALMVILLFGLFAAIGWNVVCNPCRKFLTIFNLCIAIYIVVMAWFAARGLAAARLVAQGVPTDRDFYLRTLVCMVILFVLGSFLYSSSLVRVAGYATGNGVSWLGYPEYYLNDYDSLLIPLVTNNKNWKRYRSCIVDSGVCKELPKRFENLEDDSIRLTPIEAGCCRPPSKCDYPAVNASFYDLNDQPARKSKDCKIYENSLDIKCYDCNSCKAGVLENLKREFLFAVVCDVFLMVFLLVVGWCVYINARSL